MAITNLQQCVHEIFFIQKFDLALFGKICQGMTTNTDIGNYENPTSADILQNLSF